MNVSLCAYVVISRMTTAKTMYWVTPACGVAGAGGNGAIIHYRAEKGSCKVVDKDTLLLLDSGGQYDCGTTDVTRTMHFGTPTDHQKMCFTRVLQVLLSSFSASLITRRCASHECCRFCFPPSLLLSLPEDVLDTSAPGSSCLLLCQ